jgi:hypothetical protein
MTVATGAICSDTACCLSRISSTSASFIFRLDGLRLARTLHILIAKSAGRNVVCGYKVDV